MKRDFKFTVSEGLFSGSTATRPHDACTHSESLFRLLVWHNMAQSCCRIEIQIRQGQAVAFQRSTALKINLVHFKLVLCFMIETLGVYLTEKKVFLIFERFLRLICGCHCQADQVCFQAISSLG